MPDSKTPEGIPMRDSGTLFPLEPARKARAASRRMPKLDRITYRPTDRERQHEESPDSGDERSQFEIDRSRIIHSSAFRRLQGKTQVFAVGSADFFRTRLTHSLEVAQIGKGLALRLTANPDLIEAISLAHDLGHPPFGHAGERELSTLMRDHYGGFEANAQNLRLLTLLERKSEKYPGLNLTRATIDGQLKYKWLFAPNKEKFCYVEDAATVRWATEGVIAQGAKSFECQVMDWADDIAYAVHDLEDGIHSGFVGASTFADQKLASQIVSRTHGKLITELGTEAVTMRQLEKLWGTVVAQMQTVDKDLTLTSMTMPGSSDERKSRRKTLTSFLISRFIRAARRKKRQTSTSPPANTDRYLYEVDVPPEIKAEAKLLNCLVWHTVMTAPQVVTLEEKGRHMVGGLFLKLMEGDNAARLLPTDWREAIWNTSSEAARALREKARRDPVGSPRRTCPRLSRIGNEKAGLSRGRWSFRHLPFQAPDQSSTPRTATPEGKTGVAGDQS